MIVWLASYPRSGNTFLRVVLKSAFGLDTYSIYNDKSDIAKDPATAEVVGHKFLPEDFDLDAARKSDKQYIIKTHELFESTSDKVIYLLRDGRESTVSYFNYIKSFHNQDCKIEDVLFGNVPFGSWAEHVKSWNPHNSETMLLLKFEEFTANPRSFLNSLSDFIQAGEPGHFIPDFSELHKINPEFFRQGRHDSWKKELTPDEVLLFWLTSYSPMQRFYPKESPTEILPEPHLFVKFSDLFCRQNTYFRNAVRNLQTQKRNLDTQKKFLATERSELLHQRDSLKRKCNELERQRTDVSGQKAELESLLHSVECELNAQNEHRSRIESVTTQLIDIKAWKAPVRKYKAYKKLLQVVFQPGR